MNCQMCDAPVIFRAEWNLYECSACVRRWISWPPDHPVLVMGMGKGMTWNAKLQRAWR